MDRKLAVIVPHVPYGPDHQSALASDAAYYREAAANIRFAAAHRNSFAGSHVTEAVARLCDNTAEALKAAIADSYPLTEGLTQDAADAVYRIGDIVGKVELKETRKSYLERPANDPQEALERAQREVRAARENRARWLIKGGTAR